MVMLHTPARFTILKTRLDINIYTEFIFSEFQFGIDASR